MERRQFGRRRTALHAWIKVAGRPPLACVVRDLSVNGALLEMEAPHWLPYRFELDIETSGFRTDCEIRHQSPYGVGVMFVERSADSDVYERRYLVEEDVWAGTAASRSGPSQATRHDRRR
ncbi:MAG: PilZ domain-containing protein [Hyphomicrobiaceae bacterium]